MSSGRTGVLAVLVTAGNTPYLRRTLVALARQEVPASAVLVVDVASRRNGLGDGTPVEDVVELSGIDAVSRARILHVSEAFSFGDAVRRGLLALQEDGRLPAPSHPYLWLLHDDSAPAPGCLASLLNAVTSARSVALAGPKQVDWDNPEQLLEVGLRTTASARRANDIVPGEIDQGQHDGRSDVLAVGTAGALVDRAVFDEIGGISPAFGAFGDGLELSRAVRLAGHRVVVVPDAVVAHRRAAFLGRRGVRHGLRRDPQDTEGLSWQEATARSYRARRTAQLRAWATFSSRPVWLLLSWFLLLACLRAPWRLLTNSVVRASDEMGAALAVASRPGLIRRGRRRLAAHATVPRSVLTRLYVDSAEIRALRRDLVRQERERAAREEAPSELELHELRALARRRRYVLTAVLLLTAGAGLLALGGTLASRGLTGGALPSLDTAPGRLWEAAWSTWAASGDGYDSPLSPFLAVLALPVALGRVVGLDGPLMLHALVLVAVPLGALGAWAAAGTVTRRTHLRAWVALTWALAPAGLLAVGQGRLGPLLVHVLLPWALTALMRGLGADRRDVVLSGMVGAHHLTDSERAELDRLSPPADLPRQGAAGAQGTGAQGADADGLRGAEPAEADDVEDGDGAEEAAEDGGGVMGTGTAEAPEAGSAPRSPGEPRDASRAEARAARALAGAAAAGHDESADHHEGVDHLDQEASATISWDEDEERQVSAGAEPADTAGAGSTESGAGPDARGDREDDQDPAAQEDESPSERSLARAAAVRAAATEQYGPGSPRAAALAGLLGAGIVAAVPATAVVLLPALVLLMVRLPRRAGRLALTVLPVLVTALPVWWGAWHIAHSLTGTARLLLADTGAPLGAPAPSATEALLGLPQGLDTLLPASWLAGVVMVLLAVPHVLALVGLAAPGRLGARARGGVLLFLGGLALALVAPRVVVALGTGLEGTGSQFVAAWPGPGASLALAGLLGAGAVGLDAGGVRLLEARAWWRTALVRGVGTLVLVAPLALGGAWAAAVATRASSPLMLLRPATSQVPLIALEMETAPAAGRVLALASTDTSEGTVLSVSLWRGAGTQVTDVVPGVLASQLTDRIKDAGSPDAADVSGSPGLVRQELSDAADAELAHLVTRMTTTSAKDAAGALARHGISVVVLADRDGDELTSTTRAALSSTPGMEDLARTATGTAWRVSPDGAEVARAALVGPDGTSLTLPFNGTAVRTGIEAGAAGRTLVLAERTSWRWRATLDGVALEPTTLREGAWRQAFTVPASGGQLVVTPDRPTTSLASWLVRATWALTAVVAVLARPRRRSRRIP
ncbi:glycosyltransferase [Actinomyces sp. HMT897]|uniref:glycosyltransferase n=1 Tax=Actinomyces sp. HMT897 TaxID=2789424 RepID=UPI00190938B9|nr:glycosyltransferase [Actinomyces sp. HMT897]QQO78319.1 glycosyltransferase family 2 protein [Actinomyces sp. HMT897]